MVGWQRQSWDLQYHWEAQEPWECGPECPYLGLGLPLQELSLERRRDQCCLCAVERSPGLWKPILWPGTGESVYLAYCVVSAPPRCNFTKACSLFPVRNVSQCLLGKPRRIILILIWRAKPVIALFLSFLAPLETNKNGYKSTYQSGFKCFEQR